MTSGVAVNHANINGDTPLHFAALHGNPHATAMLLAVGAGEALTLKNNVRAVWPFGGVRLE